MDPLTLSLGVGTGIASFVSDIFGQSEQRKAIQEQNRRIANAQSMLREQLDLGRKDAVSSLGDIKLNYITSRDPNKSQGFMSMYSTESQGFNSLKDRLNNAIANLEIQKSKAPSVNMFQSLGQGLGSGFGTYSSLSNLKLQDDIQNYFKNKLGGL